MILYLVMWMGLASVVTLAMYGADKWAAKTGRWRTRESTLHLWSLVGGWPGAWLGQRLFRHKTRQRDFLRLHGLMVVANIALVGAIGFIQR